MERAVPDGSSQSGVGSLVCPCVGRYEPPGRRAAWGPTPRARPLVWPRPQSRGAHGPAAHVRSEPDVCVQTGESGLLVEPPLRWSLRQADLVFLQVRGHDLKVKKNKVDKQEVEIHRRMTVASLAEAMNRDTGQRGHRVRGGVALAAPPPALRLQITCWRRCSTPDWIWTLWIRTRSWRRSGSKRP